jgi:osmotically-inducible protein OsmY
MAERDDLDLTEHVRDELAGAVAASDDVVVTVQDGALMLSGRVSSYAEKLAATEAAVRVAGIRALANELRVDVAEAERPDDRDLAEAAAYALKWNASVPDTVHATVDSGWITMGGEVTRPRERVAAEQAMSMLVGVMGVTNRIRVRLRAHATDIEKSIERALARSVFVDEHHIRVHVREAEVTLRGTARSWAVNPRMRRMSHATHTVLRSPLLRLARETNG